jgi:hypothetical protein
MDEAIMHNSFPTKKRLVAAFALLSLLSAGRILAAAVPADCWIIDTREASRCAEFKSADMNSGAQKQSGDSKAGSPRSKAEGISFWHLQDDKRWRLSEEESFFAADDPEVPTIIFIHGNRDDWNQALDDAWLARKVLKEAARGRPFRFAIWSWPSERVGKRARPDVQLKASYSDVESYYLAERLADFKPEVPVSMIGYSFGARIITGALHLLGGGEVAGRRLDRQLPEHRKPFQAVLVAAATDADSLHKGRCNGLCLAHIDRMLVTVNGCDPALRWYPRMYGRCGPSALGYTGPAGDLNSKQLELLDVTCGVGNVHAWECYIADPSLRSRLARYAYLEPNE